MKYYDNYVQMKYIPVIISRYFLTMNLKHPVDMPSMSFVSQPQTFNLILLCVLLCDT